MRYPNPLALYTMAENFLSATRAIATENPLAYNAGHHLYSRAIECALKAWFANAGRVYQ